MTTPRNGGECCLHLWVLATGFCLSCGEQITEEPFDVEAARDMAADREYDALREEGMA